MKCKRTDLLAAFNAVAHLATKRNSLPILNCVTLSNDGRLHIDATDLNCFATATIDCEGVLNRSACVNAAALGGLLHGESEYVEIDAKDGRVRVTVNGTATLATDNADAFPACEHDALTPLAISCADLADCIDGVAWACPTKETGTFWHRLIRVRSSAKELDACGGTGTTYLAVMTRKIIGPDATLIFPATSAALLVDALRREGATLSASDAYIVVSSPDLWVAVKKADMPYPNTDAVVKQERKKMGKVKCAEVMSALSVITGLCVEDFAPVVITPGAKTTIAYTGDANSYTTEINAKLKGDAFKINAKLLQSALRRIDGDATWAMCNGALFIEDGDFMALIALLKQ
jgi:DNA polymerase III sliding clamp (beta) subunit (PCNA family)